jgi:hypothetical protein
MPEFLNAIEAWPLSETIRSSPWAFPLVEILHVIAIVFVVGSIARVDLRLLGLVWRNRPVTQVSAEMLPWTWSAFLVALITGVLLFLSSASRYVGIIYFDVKMVLIVLAGLNMVLFHFMTYRSVARWNADVLPPFPARAAAAVSLVLWLGVITTGRFIGFI